MTLKEQITQLTDEDLSLFVEDIKNGNDESISKKLVLENDLKLSEYRLLFLTDVIIEMGNRIARTSSPETL